MTNKQTLFPAVLLLCALFLAPSAEAAESASFKLYSEFPNYAERTAKTSDSYVLNEDGMTWHALPGLSANFMIVTAPPAQSSATSSAGVSEGSSAPTDELPDGGGRRSSASSVSSVPSSAGSSQSAQTVSSRRPTPTLPIPRPTRPAEPVIKPPVPRQPGRFEEVIRERKIFTFAPHGAAPVCPAASKPILLASLNWPWLLIILLSLTILALSARSILQSEQIQKLKQNNKTKRQSRPVLRRRR